MRFIIILFYTLTSLSLSFAATPSAETTEAKKNRLIKQDIENALYATNGSWQGLVEVLRHSRFNELDFRNQSKVIDKFADTAAYQIKNSQLLLKDIYISKLYKFTYASLSKLMGHKYKHLTDLTYFYDQHRKKIVIVLLSTEPPTTTEASIRINLGYGIYYQKLAELNTKEFGEQKIFMTSWIQNAELFDAQLTLDKKIMHPRIVEKAQAPDYNGILRDKVFKTLVVVSSNIPEYQNFIVDNYIKYFVSKELRLVQTIRVSDTKRYLADQIHGQEPADIFVKEAHSSGDEKNLMPVAQKSIIYRYEKKHANFLEVVELAVPSSKETELISNQDFGRWMQIRNRSVNAELIYLNTSCWSDHKAIIEIVAANTPLLINIPSITMTSLLNANDPNGTYLLVDGFRQMKSYAEIRKDLADYQKRTKRLNDQYIFPNEPEYQQKIINALPPNFEVTVDIQRIVNNQPIPYSIEDVEEH